MTRMFFDLKYLLNYANRSNRTLEEYGRLCYTTFPANDTRTVLKFLQKRVQRCENFSLNLQLQKIKK